MRQPWDVVLIKIGRDKKSEVRYISDFTFFVPTYFYQYNVPGLAHEI